MELQHYKTKRLLLTPNVLLNINDAHTELENKKNTLLPFR